MYSIILSIIIFLILYIWRKIASIESYLFILEKRINNIKKPISSSFNENEIYLPKNINENIRAADMIMSEVFNNICCDNQVCSNIIETPKEKRAKKTTTCMNTNSCISTPFIVEHTYTDEIKLPIFNKQSSPEISQQFSSLSLNLSSDLPSILKSELKSDLPSELPSDLPSEIRSKELNDILSIQSEDDKLERDTTKSEIMTTIKLSGRKLLKLDLGKLKEYCAKLNVSSEGTKTQIIDRLLLL